MCKSRHEPVRTCKICYWPVRLCTNDCWRIRTCKNHCGPLHMCINLCGLARFFEKNFERQRMLKNGFGTLYYYKKRLLPLPSMLTHWWINVLCVINMARQNKMQHYVNKSVTYVHMNCFFFTVGNRTKISLFHFLADRWISIQSVAYSSRSIGLYRVFGYPNHISPVLHLLLVKIK
jgi:hypothetical protein